MLQGILIYGKLFSWLYIFVHLRNNGSIRETTHVSGSKFIEFSGSRIKGNSGKR